MPPRGAFSGEIHRDLDEAERTWPTQPHNPNPGDGRLRCAAVSTGLRLEMLEAAMRQVAEGVVIVDRKGRFVFWNEAAQRIVGMGPLGARLPSGRPPTAASCRTR